MQLAEEQNKRIRVWMEELRNHIFSELQTIEFEGFTTKERLSFDEAMKREFYPMPEGTPWGGKWEYGWFRTWFSLPKEAEGQRIYLHPEVGGEMLVWVNGKTVGSKDLQHGGITLTTCGRAGETFEIVTESYAGHGPRLENGGPCPAERIPVPEPPSCQVVVGACNYGIWNEEAYQLLMDVYTLVRLYQGLDPKSLRAMKVKAALMEFTKLADFELEPEARKESFLQARAALLPALSCVNGSTAPVFTIFGQSHLDLAWKWPWEETRRKCARTISSQLALSDEYDEYKFLLCEPPIMENLKENYPELYVRVLEKVKEGKFIPEGGMYVESDTNLVSGESLIRQCLYGRRWFREELGTDSVMVWLPDCFGFSGQLPQIFRGCGLKYFSSQKLARALKGCDVFPYNTFLWEGIDGTRILTNFHKENNAKMEPLDLINRWNEDRVQQENIETFLYPFGYGDGGGGATREMAEMARRCMDLEGAPRTKMGSPVEFFREIEENGLPEEVYRGELYLPWHRGTYTSQARMKKENRRAEEALREAGMWNSIGTFCGVTQDRQAELEILWKKVLFNQFHDVLPGTSITRVYEDALKDLDEVMAGADVICREAMEMLKKVELNGTSGLLIYNSLSWDREELVTLPGETDCIWEQNGRRLPAQKADGGVIVPVTIPACGFSVVRPADDAGGVADSQSAMDIAEFQPATVKMESDSTYILENQYIRARIDRLGRLVSYVDRETGTEFMDQAGNEFCMYQDINVDYDAWELASFYHDLPVELEKNAEIAITAAGPLKTVLQVKRQLRPIPPNGGEGEAGYSELVQEIILGCNSRRIDFKTKIDWKERHKILKVSFPYAVHCEEAVEEIQFGCIRRPTHQNRRSDADRFEVVNHRYTALSEPERTAAVLNDCKYGVSTFANNIELTLLKAPVWPDMYADQGIHEFTYSAYGVPRGFSDSRVVREGYELNHPLIVQSNSVMAGTAGRGENASSEGISTCRDQSFFHITGRHVILETVKLAEDRSDDLVLRLYEAVGSHSSCTIGTPLAFMEACETTMEELAEAERGLEVRQKEGHSQIDLTFAPFEIKTVRLKKMQ